MKILVLVKVVPKQTTLPLSSDFMVKREEVTSVINPYDYYALEVALRLKQECGAEVNVVTLGSQNCLKVLTEAYALGADNVYLISDSIFRGSDTFATANALKSFFSKIQDIDLIIAGKKSSDGSTSQVPNELSVILGWDSVNNVIKYSHNNESMTVVERYEEYDVQREVNYPFVMSIAEGSNTPRLPSIEGIINSRKKNVTVLTNNDLNSNSELVGINGSKTVVSSIEKIKISKDRKKKILTDKNDIITSLDNLDKIEFKRTESQCNNVKSVNIDSHEKIFVFLEMNEGEIKEESLYVVKKAAQIATKSHASVITLSTKHSDVDKNMRILGQIGVSQNYELLIDDILLVDKIDVCREMLKICDKVQPSLILFASTMMGLNVAPCFAALSQSGLTAECINIEYIDNKYIQKRPALGGRMNANIYSKNSKFSIATVKPYVEKINVELKMITVNKTVSVDVKPLKVNIIRNYEDTEINQKIVIGCGCGIERKEFVEQVKQICVQNGYGFCSTRELVDKGWVSSNTQVGLTGKIISPDIYIAIGISGAYEHIVGVEQSNVIISVNKNLNAPIINTSDIVFNIDSKEFINLLVMEEKQ